MICQKCLEDKKPTEFYKKGKHHKPSYCKLCFNSYCMDRWKQRKARAIEHMGGKCSDCKGKFHYSVYDFHHLKDKDYSWNKLRLLSVETLERELAKCVLLCANCHRTRHYSEE